VTQVASLYSGPLSLDARLIEAEPENCGNCECMPVCHKNIIPITII